MVDEREDRYDDEEGEYHFSDDQLNYDEVEAPKTAQSAATIKKSLTERLSGLSPSRRMLIAGGVFVTLIFIVYKMLSPSSGELPTDIAQITPIKKPTTPTATAKPVVTPARTPIGTPPPATQAIATTPTESIAQNPNAAMPSTAMPSTGGVLPVGMQNATQSAQNNFPPASYPAAQMGTPSGTPTGMPPSTSPGSTPPGMTPTGYPTATSTQSTVPVPVPQTVTDRVKAVEDHNAAMMNLLQTEYAQKLSEFEMQSSLVRGKMDEMAKRISRIETGLNQITQMLQQNAGPAAGKAQAMGNENAAFVPVARPSAIPKNTYTVQAIIPGRAWLKADSGDTVTVAEGDTLRDYGRISKIDPYDGVVEIDTGTKVIALSYGMNAE